LIGGLAYNGIQLALGMVQPDWAMARRVGLALFGASYCLCMLFPMMGASLHMLSLTHTHTHTHTHRHTHTHTHIHTHRERERERERERRTFACVLTHVWTRMSTRMDKRTHR
jgi:hypothetical protein